MHLKKYAIDRKLVESHYHMPLAEAARSLGISPTWLKTICRGLGISRWPFRQGARKHVRKSHTEPLEVHNFICARAHQQLHAAGADNCAATSQEHVNAWTIFQMHLSSRQNGKFEFVEQDCQQLLSGNCLNEIFQMPVFAIGRAMQRLDTIMIAVDVDGAEALFHVNKDDDIIQVLREAVYVPGNSLHTVLVPLYNHAFMMLFTDVLQRDRKNFLFCFSRRLFSEEHSRFH